MSRSIELSDEDYERLSSELSAVYHLAAIYDITANAEGRKSVVPVTVTE